jgi:hypothetical protein
MLSRVLYGYTILFFNPRSASMVSASCVGGGHVCREQTYAVGSPLISVYWPECAFTAGEIPLSGPDWWMMTTEPDRNLKIFAI